MKPTAAEKLGIQPFDAAFYLESEENCMYLQACLEQAPDDVALFAKALGEQGNPTLSTVLKVLHALAMQLHIDARPKHA